MDLHDIIDEHPILTAFLVCLFILMAVMATMHRRHHHHHHHSTRHPQRFSSMMNDMSGMSGMSGMSDMSGMSGMSDMNTEERYSPQCYVAWYKKGTTGDCHYVPPSTKKPSGDDYYDSQCKTKVSKSGPRTSACS